MLPRFYQAHLQTQLSPNQYILLNLLTELWQWQKQVRLERLTSNLPLSIQFESCRRQLQRFLVCPQLTLQPVWFGIINYLLAHYFAVDQEGNVLDILLQGRRDKQAAKKFFRKLLKRQGFAPRVLVTDKLKSYRAARQELLPNTDHRQHKGLNNRAENSHQPTRTRERRMVDSSLGNRLSAFLRPRR